MTYRRADRPGLHSERTLLAWIRTGATLAVGGLGGTAAALRHEIAWAMPVCFALAALTGAILLTRAGVRFRRVGRALREGRPLDDTFDARLAWLGTLAVAVGGLALVADLCLSR